MRKLITILALVLCTAGWLESLTLEEYLQLRKDDSPASQQIINSYIGGMGEGLAWANTGCEITCNKRLFCPSKSVALQPQIYVDVLNKKIDKDMNTINMNPLNTEQKKPLLVILLLQGLEETFPCEKK